MSLRSTLSSALRRTPALHRAVRTVYRALPPSIRGRKMVHDHLRNCARKRRTQTFLLVGANDGVFSDHLYDFARRYQWRGIAVEPVPQYFKQLSRNYAGLPVHCVNMAVHRTERSMPFYFLDDADPDLPEWVQGVGSFDRDQVVQATRDVPDVVDRIQQIDVPCAPLPEIVQGAGLEQVDVIVVDVEGYDHEIIRQVDLAAWKPHTIIFEYKHIPPADLEEVCDRLVEAGYHLDRDHEDILASRPMS